MPACPTRARLTCASLLLLAATAGLGAQAVTAPREHFGFDIGDDYQLATYTQFAAYWQALDRESDRVRVVEIGRTVEDRPQLMAIVTAPENHRVLDRYREIARRLALGEGLDDGGARALSREGKAVVWIDGGLHANEVLGAHQLLETVYRLASGTDAETLRILSDVIVLAVHANPDGMELVSSWYMRHANPLDRGTGPGIPRLYQKYIGHDNNRDFYLSSQPETTNMNRVLYHEWFPQVVYNHHQSGPAGTVMFAPPFRDPFNYRFDPLIPAQLDLVAAAMHSRFAAESKPGVTSRRGAPYSTWWNGGLRTTAYFHNMIGLLTETIGGPTPTRIPFLPARQLPDSNLHLPIEPQPWRFRQSVEYSVTANYAVLDIASRNREGFLFNIYRMARNAIDRGSRDHWTPAPRRIEAAREAITGSGSADDFARLLRDPAARDPRGYILPADQPDFPTATRFVDALMKTGVAVHRAAAVFEVSGRRYPAGSYVVLSAQAFRPHVLDMFEPQDHPDDVPYPGGPPTRPYDSAGWTLAFQMGVVFDRILEGFDAPLERLDGPVRPPAGRVTGDGRGGYLLSRATTNAFIAVNRLLAAGHRVVWMTSGPSAGAFVVGPAPALHGLLERLTSELGVSFDGLRARPPGDATALRRPRIGLADHYGGSMPSGWTRWILEQFEFPFDVVFPQALDAGDLASRYDVIIFPSGVWPAAPDGTPAAGGKGEVPAEFRHMQGAYTNGTTGPQLLAFVERGGTLVGVGRSTPGLARLFELPVGNHVAEIQPDGTTRPRPPEQYFVPGSVLRMRVDPGAPVAHGVADPVDIFFDNSPVFRLLPDAAIAGVRPFAWFDTARPLRSGWAHGQAYLDGGVQGIDATRGAGRLYLFAPEITFRAQPHGTFKFLFNAIHLSARRPLAATE
jgi:hypothetical protein